MSLYHPRAMVHFYTKLGWKVEIALPVRTATIWAELQALECITADQIFSTSRTEVMGRRKPKDKSRSESASPLLPLRKRNWEISAYRATRRIWRSPTVQIGDHPTKNDRQSPEDTRQERKVTVCVIKKFSKQKATIREDNIAWSVMKNGKSDIENEWNNWHTVLLSYEYSSKSHRQKGTFHERYL